jgi:hypothetical protein
LLASDLFLAHRLRVGQQEHIKDIIGSLKDMSAFGQKRTFDTFRASKYPDWDMETLLVIR